jgi:glycosyl transferase family 25
MGTFFDQLNNFFDKIYVLTIPSAIQRQQEFARSMEGLKFEFFFGMDKQLLLTEQNTVISIYNDEKARRNQRYGKSMTPGEIACAWGHRSIYEHIIANNVKRALIFEDDVFPLAENSTFLPEIMRTMPEGWDILFFDYHKNENPVPLKKTIYHLQHLFGFLTWDHTLINNLYPRAINKHWKTAGYHDFADAYAITNIAAKKLVEMQTPLAAVADNLLANAVTKRHLKGYISVPKLFAQRSAGKYKSVETLVEKPIKSY